MKKYFCDKCGIELTDTTIESLRIQTTGFDYEKNIDYDTYFEFCGGCHEKAKELIVKLFNDFLGIVKGQNDDQSQRKT